MSPDLAHASFSMDVPVLVATSTDLTVDPRNPLNLKAMATMTALRHNISTTTLFNLVDSESNWDSEVPGDKGCSYGLVQINTCAHPDVSKKEATDPQFALDYAAQAIADGKDDAWSVCNCYSFIQANYIHNLPHMADIRVNTNIPHKGDVAIFWYKDRTTGELVKHIAYVLDDAGTVREANKTHCLVGTRLIPMNDPYLAGYYDPAV